VVTGFLGRRFFLSIHRRSPIHVLCRGIQSVRTVSTSNCGIFNAIAQFQPHRISHHAQLGPLSLEEPVERRSIRG
jgi:hypothetical protein